MIKSLILRVIPVWKHFNFMAHLHALFCMFCMRLKNHHNIFLARLMGHIFVKHYLLDSLFDGYATKIEK